MPFVDIRIADDDSVELQASLSTALQFIDEAGPDYSSLVRRHIAFVAATREPEERMSDNLHAYLSPFTGHERRNPMFLACRLVGIGEYLRALQETQDQDDTSRRQRAIEREVEFIHCFPNADEWEAYIRRTL